MKNYQCDFVSAPKKVFTTISDLQIRGQTWSPYVQFWEHDRQLMWWGKLFLFFYDSVAKLVAWGTVSTSESSASSADSFREG